MYAEFNHKRALYYPPNDLAAGMYVKRVIEILPDDAREPQDINDAIEFHQCKLILDAYPEFFDSEEVSTLRSNAAQSFSCACKLINKLADANSLSSMLDATEHQYVEQYFDLLVHSGAYKRISSSDAKTALDTHPGILSCFLSHSVLAERFKNSIKTFLIENPAIAAKFLIGAFGTQSRRQAAICAPSQLSNKEIDAIMLEYLNQEHANLNHVRILSRWPSGKSRLSYSPSKEVLVAARKRAAELNQMLFEEGSAITHSVSILITPEQTACKGIKVSDSKYEFSYSAEWLSKYTDPGTILNNFIYVFDLIDSKGLLQTPAHKHERSTLLSTLGLHAIGEYHSSPQFELRNNVTVGILSSYRAFLERQSVRIEDAFEWAFNEYLRDEFGIEGFSISLPTTETSFLDKCKAIGPEIERVVKAFILYVEKGCVDEEFFQFMSLKDFSGIPSLIEEKYVEAGPDFELHSGLLFSDQSLLAFSENHKEASQQFYAMMTECKLTRADFHDYCQPLIDKLIEEKTLEIDENGIFHPTPTAQMLKLVWDHGAVEICKYSESSKILARELVGSGWLSYSNSLLSSDEAGYLNYMFNDASYSNSIALRNKYDHGSFSVKDPNADSIINDYAGLLVVLACVTLKIFDDISFKLGLGGVEDFVDWPWIDDSVIESINKLEY